MSTYKTIHQLKQLGAVRIEDGRMLYRSDGLVHLYEEAEYPVYQPQMTIDESELQPSGIEVLIAGGHHDKKR